MTEAAHRVVIIDNYDSFVYNLHQYIGEITGVAPLVYRNDAVNLDQIRAQNPSHIVISPGPGNPEDPAYFGVCRDTILNLGKTIPLLGVCLGHQGIGACFGGRVVRAPQVRHGKTSVVLHDGTGVFKGLSSPLTVMRYHSLVVDPNTLPSSLRVCARTEDNIIMGLSHKEYPIMGVQFHPESIGTPDGLQLLRNFLG